ncbi:MAG: T9SS type A sorting domain-containing protein [Bacteroidales bacterium]|nr:T9SS type A sorting domain-containing protein [Bacteroidales bacterium]
MRKTLTLLSALLLLTASTVMAQTPNGTNTQFPNPGFEHWDYHSSAPSGTGTDYKYVPTYWHTFDEVEISGLGANTAKANHHNRYSATSNAAKVHSGSHSIGLFVETVLTVKANGTMTTGRTKVGNKLNPSSSDNYNYDYNGSTASAYQSFGNGHFYFEFVGCPDSLSLYYQTNWTSSSIKPMIKVFAHQELPFYDKANGDLDPTNKIIFQATPHFATSNGTWSRGVGGLTYNTSNYPYNGDNNPSTISRPQYLLASPSTSQSAGSGSDGHEFIMDDLYFIYDKGLSSLSIGDSSQSSMLSSFNAAEFATHEPTRTYSSSDGSPTALFNSGSTSANYTTLVCCSSDADIPQVAATAKSEHISSIVIDQATIATPHATIVVTHNDGSTFTYTINFTNLHPAISVSLNGTGSSSNIYSACAGETINVTATASGSSSYNYSWSNGASSATIHPTTSGEYALTVSAYGCTATNTAYVTVKPLPVITFTGTPSICSGQSTTLTAEGATSFVWSNGLENAAINVPSGGTYSVTGTTNGCSNSASITVTAYDAPDVDISGPANGVACSTDEIVLTASGASSYTWSGGFTTDTIHPSSSNIYSVTGTDSHGCTASASFDLTVNTTPTVSINGNTSFCEGSNTTLTASSNLANTTYLWSDGTTTANALTVSTAGTYSVTGTLNNCSSSYTVTVTESAAPSAPIVTNSTVSRCGAGEVTLSATSDEGTIYWYANATTAAESHIGATYTIESVASSTTYYAAVRNSAGCESSRVPVTVTINAVPAAPAATTPSICGAGEVTLTVTAADNCTLAWYTDAAGTQTLDNTTVQVDTTTTYYVANVNTDNCPSELTPVTVTVNPVPGVPTFTQTTFCKSDGNVTMSGAPGDNGTVLRWRSSADGSVLAQNNSYITGNVGIYYVSTYNANTTCESQQVTVELVETPSAPTAPAVTLCATGTASLAVDNPSSDYTYTWYSDADLTNLVGTGSTIDVTVSADATYYVTAQSDDCESGATSVAVTIRETIDAPTLTPIYACDGNATLPSTYGSYTLEWKDASNTPVSELNVTVASGSATYTATYDVNGCESQPATVTVTYEAIPTISASGNSRCGNGTVELSATSSAGTIYWFTSQNSANAFVNSTSSNAGTGATFTTPSLSANATYYVRALSNGCLSSVASAVATVNALPNVSVTATKTSICEGQSTTLTASNATTYTWNNDQEGASITVSPQVTTIYTVVGVDDNECSNTNEITVTVNALPGEPNLTQTTYCKGSGNLPLTGVTAGTNGDGLRWRTTQDYSAAFTPDSYSATTTGTVYVSTVNTTTGCESDMVAVAVVAKPATPTASDVTLCAAGTASLAVTNPSSDYTYTWYSNTDLTTSVGTGSSIDVIVNTDATYYVTAQANGCESESTAVAVTIRETIDAPELTTPIYACGGNATLPSTSGNNTLTWKDANGNGVNDLSVSITSGSANYTATYEVNGCESQPAQVTVTYAAVPSFTATGATRCGAGEVTLNVTSDENDIEYKWYTNNNVLITTTTGNYNVTPTATTSYKVVARNTVTGCESQPVTVTATVNPVPAAPAATTPSICGAGEVTLTATPATNCTLAWYTDAAGTQPLTNTTVQVEETSTYYVANVNADNCQSALTPIIVTVKEIPGVPTVTNPGAQCLTGTNVQVSLTATVGADGNYAQWYDANMTALTHDTYGARISTTTTFYVSTIGTNGCESEAISVEVVVNPLPATPSISGTSRCGAGEVTFVATPAENIQYRWYSNDNTYITATEGNYTTNVETTTTFKVAAYNTETGCESTKATVVATVNTLPSAPQVTPIANCGGTTVTLTATAATGCTLTWYSDENGTQVLNSTTQEVAETTSFFVKAIDQNGCESALQELVVTINEIPAAPEVATPDVVCKQGSVTLTATPATDCIVRWYDANNQYLAAGNTYTTSTINSTTQYNAVSYDETTQCSSSATVVEVPVYALPPAPAMTAEVLCGPGQVNIVAQTITGVTTTWYQDADTTIYLGTGSVLPAAVEETTTFYAVNTDNTTNCASNISNISVIVYPTYNVEFDVTACVQYEWDNEIFTISDDITRTFETVDGCDSVVTMHLTINPALSTDITVDECDSWTWNDETYTESGDYDQTFTSAVTGCDSVVTAHVTIRHSTASQQSLTICSNELPYAYAGAQITSAGVKTITIENEQGCDSVITLTVTVNPQPEVPTLTDASRCGAGAVTLNASFGTNGTTCRWYEDMEATTPFREGGNYNVELTETTTYYVSSYNVNTGCESARMPVTATINEVPAQPTVENVERCGAGSVTMTVDPTQAELSYRWYVNNTITTPLQTAASYTTNIQNTTIFYVDAYNATTGCRSARTAVTATMNTIPTAPVTTNAENCGEDSFQLENYVTSTPNTTFRWYESQEATTPLATADNYTTGNVTASRSFFVSNYNETTTCESPMSEIQITIYPVYEPTTIEDETCQGELYTNYGQNTTYNEAGQYSIVLSEQSSNGCDSLVTLVVTVNPVSTAAYSDEVCAGTQYQGYGFDTTAMNPGTYTLTHHNDNVYGCDSTTTLTLKVNPVETKVINTTICATATYSFNGQTLNQPGTYTAHLQTVNGCDSTVILNLSVAAEYRDTIVAHICAGDAYTQNGFNANATGFYTQDLVASNGCDSVVVLNLTVHQLSTTNLTDEICLGETYNQNGFQVTPTAAGLATYQRVVPTQYGCDSTVNLALTVNPVYHFDETATICDNEQYEWLNHNVEIGMLQAGTYTYNDNLQTVSGCDSTYTLTLTVLPTYHHVEKLSFCDNSTELPYMFAGEALTQSGHYTHNFYTAAGCDSIVELYLDINPTYSINQTVEICDDELPYVWNNNPQFTYLSAGEYTINLQTLNGCDSIYHLNLIVHPTYDKDTTITVCQGALPYEFDAEHSFSAAGNYDVNLQSQYGCDSTWHVQFHVQPYARRTESATICADELPYVYDADHSYTEAGVYEIMEEQADGCNTIVTFTLNVNPTYLHYDTVTVCANTLPYIYDETEMEAAGTYTIEYQSVNGCDSIVMVTLNVTENPTGAATEYVCSDDFPFEYEGESYDEAGTYDLVFETAGCDSLVTLTIVEVPVYHFTESVETCEDALPYLWHGQSLYESGTYTDNHTSIYGCDSTYTLTFVVSDVKRSYENVSICDNEEYLWHERTLTTDGIYLDTLATLSGCDSICQLTLTVNPTYNNTLTLTVCQSEDPYYYAAADTTLDISEAAVSTIVFNKTTINGCDSITTLTLTVNPTYEFEEAASACIYDMPYSWHGKTLAEAGTYYDSLQTVNGCDSVYVLTLTVKPSSVITSDPVEICQGETYTWRNRELAESGIYRDTVMNDVTGCYDIYEVSVLAHPTYLMTDTMTICDDELPYQWRNRTLTAAGTYDVNYQTVSFCDSIYRLVLIVNPTYSFAETQNLCADEVPYTWHGQSLTTTGVYYDSLETVAGCDSIYMLTLTVNPTYSFAETQTICASEAPYQWHGLNLTASGVYYDSLQTAAGCDSVYALTLTVNPTYNFSEAENVCSYDLPYMWRGQELMTSGVYYDSLETAAGCDSVYVLTLTVNQSQTITNNAIELCEGMTQTWRGKTIAESGEYRDTVMNATGCYDIYIVNAIVHPTYHLYDTMTVCQSELPYQWAGHTFTAAATYTLNLQTASGCDSIREYTLIVNPTYSYAETQTLCAGEVPYTWHGQSLTTTGVYYDSLETVAGCDSVYMLTLTVNPTYSIPETQTICASEAPYQWHGLNLTASGVYYDSLQTSAGCDSVYVLTLTVNPIFTFNETDDVCSYDLPYLWRGQELMTSGVYYDSLETVAGCDSIYVLNLTVNQSQTITNNTIELCEGMTQTWRGQTIAETGEFRDTVMNATGCYDIYIVNAIVHPTYHLYDTMTVCQSELPYQWAGHTFNAASTYTLNLQTANGCDSIREYTLIVNPTYNYTETQSVCANDVPYTWHGMNLTTTGIYYDSLQTAAGCDSVYTLTLTVNPVSHQFDTAAVCSGELPYIWRGQSLIATGHYTDTVPNTYGCSDIFELQLTVYPAVHTTIYDTICQGDHYAQYGFDTLPATFGNIQLDGLYTSALGCDSTVTLLLTVNRTYLFTTEASTCEDVPFEWRGNSYDTAGVYYDTYQTVTGCDSVYMLTLSINPTYEIYVVDTAMREHEYVGYGLTLMPLDSGVFEYEVQNYTINGCDSIVYLTLYVMYNDGVEEYVVPEPEFKVYPNPATTYVNISGENMDRVYIYNAQGKLMLVEQAESDTHTRLELVNYPTGYYVIRIELIDGRTVQKKLVIRR